MTALDAVKDSQLKLFKRKSLLRWPLVNPFTQKYVDSGLLKVSKPIVKVFDGVSYDCVYVQLTDAGRKLLGG